MGLNIYLSPGNLIGVEPNKTIRYQTAYTDKQYTVNFKYK
jgi:hypothetical protein